MHNFKYKKQLIIGVIILVLICSICTLVFFIKFNSNKTIQVASFNKSNTQDTITEVVIPNVTTENTKFSMSDTSKKIEKFNISASNKLSDYNLYYCIKFDNISSEITDEDYIIFNDLILLIEENCTLLFKYELDGNYSKDAYEIKISNIETIEAETIKNEKEKVEKVDEKTLKKEKVDKKDKKQYTAPYFIRINYKANVVNIYSKDKDGNYTVPYKAMVCSCGKYTPTSGTYKTTNKYVWRPLINNVYGHYSTRIVNKILFHSVPYTAASNDSLEYWEYDKLGQTASEGCIRLTVKDAKWIYNNCPSGTMVEFYADSNPGPFGKPSAQKISSNVECRNWDPTDTKEGNPWHTYKEDKNEIKEETTTPETSPNNNISSNNTVSNNTVQNNTSTNNTTTQNTTKPIVNNIIHNQI